MQVKDSDLKDEANETSPAGKHKGKSHKTDPGCNVNFFVLFNVLPWLVFSNTEARCYVEPERYICCQRMLWYQNYIREILLCMLQTRRIKQW